MLEAHFVRPVELRHPLHVVRRHVLLRLRHRRLQARALLGRGAGGLFLAGTLLRPSQALGILRRLYELVPENKNSRLSAQEPRHAPRYD